MASQAWLESSLKRSARLGLEVLERASRRTVVWTDTSRPQTPIPSDEDAQRTHSELSDAFTAIAELMAQTTHHCKRFYESGCSEPSDIERTHVSRFHVSPEAQRTRSPSTGNQENTQETEKSCVSATGEEFYIEVSPGTYKITASVPDSQQQTQLVTIEAGESVNLIFDL
ncbi:A-kinase-interacting protein 1 isoform 1-T2 [Menidia menidia]